MFFIKLTVSPVKSCTVHPLGHPPLPGPAWLSTHFQTEKAKNHNQIDSNSQECGLNISNTCGRHF